MSDTVVSLDEVNKLVKAANLGYKELLGRIDQLDLNLMGDITEVIKRQNDTNEVLDRLVTVVADMSKVEKVVTKAGPSKFKIALAIGVGVYVGIKVNEALKPKKEK